MSNRHLDPSWMFSANGIRGHFAALREEESQRHRETCKAIDDNETAMLDALDKFTQTNVKKGG